MTMNMDEDISAGACRMSHLVLENRIAFDERLKDELVFYHGSEDHLMYQSKENGVYFITMGEDYLSSLKNSQWKSYDSLSSDEKNAMYDSRNLGSLPTRREK
jgi:hypothetical protein